MGLLFAFVAVCSCICLPDLDGLFLRADGHIFIVFYTFALLKHIHDVIAPRCAELLSIEWLVIMVPFGVGTDKVLLYRLGLRVIGVVAASESARGKVLLFSGF